MWLCDSISMKKFIHHFSWDMEFAGLPILNAKMSFLTGPIMTKLINIINYRFHHTSLNEKYYLIIYHSYLYLILYFENAPALSLWCTCSPLSFFPSQVVLTIISCKDTMRYSHTDFNHFIYILNMIYDSITMHSFTLLCLHHVGVGHSTLGHHGTPMDIPRSCAHTRWDLHLSFEISISTHVW